jgi:hypothetical protein
VVKWSITVFIHFVVGLQQMVKQKYKNVPRKTIHQTENKYLEFVLNISPVSFTKMLPLQILYIFVLPLLVTSHTHLLKTNHKMNEYGDGPENQPIDKMVIQYFRWRYELLDNRPIQGEFSKDGWKW